MSMLIQIVDDSPNMRETIKSVLGGVNAEFIESSDGVAAVQQYALRKPDLVIMDIRMSEVPRDSFGGPHPGDGTDGIAATRAIRSLFPNAQVIVVTQYDDNDLRIAARNAGAVGYILKDDLSDLLQIVSQ